MFINRRQFLRTSAQYGSLVGLGAWAPDLLVRAAAAAEASRSDERILVVVQLTGGNDGLNTVVPYKDDVYYRDRPKLAIPANDVLKIGSDLGFHPALQPLARLLEARQVSIIQGVGYPDPNRSHFESMDIWHTCQRKTDRRTEGWLGKYLEATHGDDTSAMHIGGGKQPFALTADRVRVPSVQSLDQFRLDVKESGGLATVQKLASAPRSGDDDLLGFLQTSTSSALDVSERLQQIASRPASGSKYPEAELSRKLQLAGQLIASDFPARIYYVELDGFDTHSQQPAAHAGLLRQLGEALEAFMGDLKTQGNQERVLTMVFSEFGRRLAENASEGTDHGAAAPVFLVGAGVKPGLLGRHPSLTDLDQGDLKHHTDFRQVYATVLQSWLKTDSASLLNGPFKPLAALEA